MLRQGNVFTGVCQEFCPWGVSATCLGRQTPGRHTPRQTLPWADTPAQCMLGYTPPSCPMHAGIRSTSGRYASYWNVFLFDIASADVQTIRGGNARFLLNTLGWIQWVQIITCLLQNSLHVVYNQRRIRDFRDRGANPKGGANLFFGGCASKILLCRSATDNVIREWQSIASCPEVTMKNQRANLKEGGANLL